MNHRRMMYDNIPDPKQVNAAWTSIKQHIEVFLPPTGTVWASVEWHMEVSLPPAGATWATAEQRTAAYM